MEAKDEKRLISRFQDLAGQADRQGYPQFSDFLDTAEQDLLLRQANRLEAGVILEGGYEGAERRIAAFCPSFLQEEIYWPIRPLLIRLRDSRFLKKRPQHRDYLGSLLGCGIERRMIGDILLVEEGAVFFTLQEMEAYLSESLHQVGAAEVEIVPFEGDVNALGGDGREVVISVASLRLDAVLGHGFGLSRNDAADLIRAGRVQIDHRLCGKADRPVAEGMIITVRGKGRLRLKQLMGSSKSGRVRMLAERFG